MKYPRIYLVLDNCFAIKRWVHPSDWMGLVRDIGFNYVQASTDNEIDPLFATDEYMDDWFSEVERQSKKTGVKLVNFYTGYQTYRTAGLAHYDRRIVEHLKKNWIYNLVKRIGKSDADGLGFCFFAIPENVMQNPDLHKQVLDSLFEDLYDIAAYAHAQGEVKVSLEQMYVPYQPPFTIEESKEYLRRVYSHDSKPLYVTLDTGHMVGQHRFLRPTAEDIDKSFALSEPDIWLGGDSVHEVWRTQKTSGKGSSRCDAVLAEMEKYPYMFATAYDTDPYIWIEKLAKYSPIFHMQQTDGTKSAHAPFTPETNKTGIITGDKLLRAILKSYEDGDELQPPVEDIYLSFEIFASNMDKKPDILRGLKQTLEYWRQFVPEDGMTLDKLVK
ncbi:MAG: sugar phosphate isomerase/epimerase [Oscillospiraceae bacterium]|nr:sugar phosphate isomerase/epimerase [Oscillospiraceae bacterium]MCL2277806.1 sugar phosphate isomerase/epimerase [Oscillospiraceae bacterium]